MLSYRDEATVAFYNEILNREGLKPRTAVDLACGTGSVTAILARQGLDVIGVDLSEEMLTVAMEKVMDMEHPPRRGSGGVRPGQPGLHHRS